MPLERSKMESEVKPLSRRDVIQQSLVAMAALTVGASAEAVEEAPAPARKPNVLFIAVDDLRPELNCFGRDWIHSPNIDALAKRGMAFHHAYCQQAVCSPSRSSLLTGTRPDTTRVWDLVEHFRKALPDCETIPQHFKNNGYFVQGMGKIFHPTVEDPQSWSVPWQTAKAPTYAKSSVQEGADTDLPAKKGKGGPAYEAGEVADNFYKDGQVAELAVKTLGQISKKPEPFFLAVGFAKPHLPFVSPKKYWDLYDEATIKLAPNPYHAKGAPEYALQGTSELRQYEGIPKQGPMGDELSHHLKHGYYASVSYTDAQIGKVIGELDRLGLGKNTIIVMWGDHGWKLGEHGEWTKHTNVENDTNAPLIVAAPGVKTAGMHSDALVEYVDIYPTLCELAGIGLPKQQLEGVSFAPLLKDPKREWKSAAFSQYPRGQKIMGYTMRTRDYRFTVWVDRNDHSRVLATELYDQTVDPQENVSVHDDPKNADLVKKLMEQWKAGWQGAKPKV